MLKIRRIIRSIIEENYQQLHVIDAKEIGIDKFKKIKVTLSNNTIDNLTQSDLEITDSSDADYGCKNIKGIIPSKNSELKLSYSFEGVDCDKYIWINPKTLSIISDFVR